MQAQRRIPTLTLAVTIAMLLLAAGLVGGCRKKDDAPAEVGKTVTTPTGAMVLIPAGEFMMGSDAGDIDEKPLRKVQIAAFLMDVREVTQESFQSLMGTNPSKFKDPTKPVERASWPSAARYCNARSIKEGLAPCYDPQTLKCDFAANGYRLPTEAEWEYACRAGTTTEYMFGADERTLGDYAWYKANAGQTTHPVGQKKPNAWGLYDILGNVAEWCNDYYGLDAYAAPGDNPKGPASSDYRVVRGGSWKTSQEQCRSAARQGESPGSADSCLGYEIYGFRCVRTAK